MTGYFTHLMRKSAVRTAQAAESVSTTSEKPIAQEHRRENPVSGNIEDIVSFDGAIPSSPEFDGPAGRYHTSADSQKVNSPPKIAERMTAPSSVQRLESNDPLPLQVPLQIPPAAPPEPVPIPPLHTSTGMERLESAPAKKSTKSVGTPEFDVKPTLENEGDSNVEPVVSSPDSKPANREPSLEANPALSLTPPESQAEQEPGATVVIGGHPQETPTENMPAGTIEAERTQAMDPEELRAALMREVRAWVAQSPVPQDPPLKETVRVRPLETGPEAHESRESNQAPARPTEPEFKISIGSIQLTVESPPGISPASNRSAQNNRPQSAGGGSRLRRHFF